VESNQAGITAEKVFFKASGLNMGLFRNPRVAVFLRILMFLKAKSKTGI